MMEFGANPQEFDSATAGNVSIPDIDGDFDSVSDVNVLTAEDFDEDFDEDTVEGYAEDVYTDIDGETEEYDTETYSEATVENNSLDENTFEEETVECATDGAAVIKETADTPQIDVKRAAEYDKTFDGNELLEHKLQEFAGKVTTTYRELDIDSLVLSEFKRVSRKDTRIGLAASVGQWGVLTPIHVMRLEDDNAYIVLEGLRRVYAAVRNKMERIPCIVWDFDDKTQGKRLAGVLSLMLHKTEDYTYGEKWELYRLLEDMDNVTPKLLEYLLNLKAGQAMKFKDIMLCEDEYADIREKLLSGSTDIDAAYRKLNNARKKEQRLEQEDAEAAVETGKDDNNDTLGTAEADAALDFNNNADRHNDAATSYEIGEPDIEDEETEIGELCTEDVDELLEEADKVSLDDKEVQDETLQEVDQTDELRQGSIYQKVGQRHPIDKEVRLGTFIRDGFHCRCCGMGGSEAYLAVLAFHHAIPVYAGGPDTKENGLTLCVNCHILLHTYLQGKLVLDESTLSDNAEKLKFKRIMQFGNIALSACKRSNVSKKQMQDLNAPELAHPRPEAYIGENKKVFEAAKSVVADTVDAED